MSENLVHILGVKFDNVTLKEALEKAIHLAKSETQHYIATPNPEFLLEAQKNPEFKKVLNESDMNIPDGMGVLWAAKYFNITRNSHSKTVKFLKWLSSLLIIPFHPKYIHTVLKERVTGADLMEQICKHAKANNLKIFLLGAREGTVEKVKEILEAKYHGIKITGTFSGTPKIEDEHLITEKVKKSEAQILFVAYGAPQQELWIHRNLHKMPNVKLAIGIGGTFDFIAKIRKRAPKFMQKTGLEWLYRLFQEPSRAKRIYNATIKFASLILKENITSSKSS
jgi:N-acetylglucosaminyldiphosphoundecaprenol N-acetyl-beta-D-mannosaminyltransferase